MRVWILVVPDTQPLYFNVVQMLCEYVRNAYLQDCNTPIQSAYQYTAAFAGHQAESPNEYYSSTQETVLLRDQRKDGSLHSVDVERQTWPAAREASLQPHPGTDITQKSLALGLCGTASAETVGLEEAELQRALGAFSESRLHQYTTQLEAARGVLPPADLSASTDVLPDRDTTNKDAVADGADAVARGPRADPACEADTAGNGPVAQSSGQAAELQEDNAWMDQYRRAAVKRYAGHACCGCSMLICTCAHVRGCLLHPSQLPAAWLWILPAPGSVTIPCSCETTICL